MYTTVINIIFERGISFLIHPKYQIDTCHTTNISEGGWFIHLFKKHENQIGNKK